jgi:tetratricopeptide (TPR) repeat protein
MPGSEEARKLAGVVVSARAAHVRSRRSPWLEAIARHSGLFGALAVSAGLFAVYAAGACRTIYVGDSGELTAAVGILGIPHPTGYPLYVLLGHLWTKLVPIGSIAYRMSLFSAACGGIACGLLCWTARREGWSWCAALFSALLLAFSPSFWAEANVQRVYPLNALFVVAATAAALEWHRSRRPAALRLAVGLCALGATNHTYLGIYGIALGLFVLLRDPSLLRRPREIAALLGVGLLGLLPYAYLPLRSAQNPRLDWGNPETLQGLLDVVLRRGFWERAWIEKPADLLVIVWDYLAGLGLESAGVGLALAVAGLLVGLRTGWPVLLPLLAMAGNFGAMALHGSRSDLFIWHRYYIPSYALAALLAGLGCQALVSRLRGSARLLPLAAPFLLFVTGWKDCDRSRYRIAEDFARRVLDSLPPGAHLSATDDNILFVLIYLHLVEKARPDVNLILQGVGGADLPALRFDPQTDPLYFTHHPNWSLPQLRIVPVGPIFRVCRTGDPPPPAVLGEPYLDGELDPQVPKDYLTQNLIGHFHFMLGQTHEEQGDWILARRQYDLAERASPDNDVLFYNLGLIYGRNGLFEEAERAFRRSEQINPRHIASLSKPQAGNRVLEMRAERERVARIERRLGSDPTLTGLVPGSAEHHRKLAALLWDVGEEIASKGHHLRALESEIGERRAR